MNKVGNLARSLLIILVVVMFLIVGIGIAQETTEKIVYLPVAHSNGGIPTATPTSTPRENPYFTETAVPSSTVTEPTEPVASTKASLTDARSISTRRPEAI